MKLESGDKLLNNICKSLGDRPISPIEKTMYKSKSGRTLLDVAMPAAIGAGVVTTFAISQGQHPAMAIGITAISTIFTVVCYRFDLI
ncbi:hypothetical protein [Chamaesiphon minutus]|uniref:Uncharacterized protein n=1 Tax=Chamaesiphon minutus (strain ATCC 27169 / PCC 6605) TaxID=1173020 RepID=K9UJF3_CHAP6|nr:hypothetical protein [Chamaesiphon minutus]AFY94314.1 hypothetical protein Cha6605_3310 [Chamaesiphon minutus PCC 6605]